MFYALAGVESDSVNWKAGHNTNTGSPSLLISNKTLTEALIIVGPSAKLV
jgi:hypothetical protein